jgi:coenzyme F420-reducing hydrogenase delta subunit
MADFEPTIIAFVCNWCTYTAADLAGTSRLGYPANVRLIRVMCTGMVDPKYVIKAFLEGADAVLVSGCHPGDCHYINGNYKARRRIKLLKEILPQFGFDDAETIREMVTQIKTLGPNEAKLKMVI